MVNKLQTHLNLWRLSLEYTLLTKPPIISYNLFLSSTNTLFCSKLSDGFYFTEPFKMCPVHLTWLVWFHLLLLYSWITLFQFQEPSYCPSNTTLVTKPLHLSVPSACPNTAQIFKVGAVVLSSFLGLCLKIIFLVSLSSIKLF